MLKAIIRLRKYNFLKTCIDVNFVWPKRKGKLNNCYNGVPNMITVAHEFRSDISPPTRVYYRDKKMVNEHVTLRIFHENNLPSIFNA